MLTPQKTLASLLVASMGILCLSIPERAESFPISLCETCDSVVGGKASVLPPDRDSNNYALVSQTHVDDGITFVSLSTGWSGGGIGASGANLATGLIGAHAHAMGGYYASASAEFSDWFRVFWKGDHSRTDPITMHFDLSFSGNLSIFSGNPNKIYGPSSQFGFSIGNYSQAYHYDNIVPPTAVWSHDSFDLVFTPGVWTQAYMGLNLDVSTLGPDENGQFDGSHTATFGLTIPNGVDFESHSGVFLTEASPPSSFPVPEPSSLVLLSVGMAGLTIERVRRSKVRPCKH